MLTPSPLYPCGLIKVQVIREHWCGYIWTLIPWQHWLLISSSLQDLSLVTHTESHMAEEKMELSDVETSLVDHKKTLTSPPNMFERLVQPCLAELVGTMFFVFIGCVSVIENVEAAGRLQPALVHGLAVAVLVACMAEIRYVEPQGCRC